MPFIIATAKSFQVSLVMMQWVVIPFIIKLYQVAKFNQQLVIVEYLGLSYIDSLGP